jgi:HrpA-like RNA helicase
MHHHHTPSEFIVPSPRAKKKARSSPPQNQARASGEISLKLPEKSVRHTRDTQPVLEGTPRDIASFLKTSAKTFAIKIAHTGLDEFGDALRLGVTPTKLQTLREKFKSHPFRHVGSVVLKELDTHPIVILSSPTGSGKTTGLALMAVFSQAVEDVNGKKELRYKKVDVIVPRCGLAADTASYTSTYFLEEPPGDTVGINTGRTKLFKSSSKIVYQTTGTAWLSLHPQSLLKEYEQKLRKLPADHLFVIDEFHERQIHVDVLLGIIIKEMQRRIERGEPCFRLVISSATIDARNLAKDLESLVHKGQKHLGKTVATVKATYADRTTKNPRVEVKTFKARIGDPEGCARKALELAQQERQVLVLSENITRQREVAEYIARLVEAQAGEANSGIKIFQVNSRSTDKELSVLTGNIPKGQKTITLSTVSRSGGTYPSYDALIDMCVVTRAHTHFIGGTLPTTAQVLSNVTEGELLQGIGRMGRIPRERKDLVVIPSQAKKIRLGKFPIPDILDSAETGSTRLSLSTQFDPGHNSPRLFDFRGLPLLVALDEKKQKVWERFLETIGVVTVHGRLSALGRLMREIPGSIESRKLIALAQITREQHLIQLACECAALVENEGILSGSSTGPPSWAKNRELAKSSRSDVIRELNYFYRLRLFVQEQGEAAAERFCARNNVSMKAFQRVVATRSKLLEAVRLSNVLKQEEDGTHAYELYEQSVSPAVQAKLIGLIQEAYLHYLMKRPSAGKGINWTCPVDAGYQWRHNRDAIVAESSTKCVALPIARLQEDLNGAISPEHETTLGKLYWTTDISDAELRAHVKKYPLIAELYEGHLVSTSRSSKDYAVKTHGSTHSGKRA